MRIQEFRLVVWGQGYRALKARVSAHASLKTVVAEYSCFSGNTAGARLWPFIILDLEGFGSEFSDSGSRVGFRNCYYRLTRVTRDIRTCGGRS